MPDSATEQPDELDLGNNQLVACQPFGDRILVMLPKPEMTMTEALVHAAWLVAMADMGGEERFPEILRAVRNT